MPLLPPAGSLPLSKMEVSLSARELLHGSGMRLFEQPSRFPWKRCWGQLPLCWERTASLFENAQFQPLTKVAGFSQRGSARRLESWPWASPLVGRQLHRPKVFRETEAAGSQNARFKKHPWRQPGDPPGRAAPPSSNPALRHRLSGAPGGPGAKFRFPASRSLFSPHLPRRICLLWCLNSSLAGSQQVSPCW